MKKEIQNTIKVLQAGGTILYPTDTVWGIGCDATNEKAVSKIYEIKKSKERNGFIILVSDTSMLNQYLKRDYPNTRNSSIHKRKSLTVVYPDGKGLASNVMGKDGSVAIRIATTLFCKQLISLFGHPIVSTSANFGGMPTPLSFSTIHPDILKSVDYVVNLQQNKQSKIRHSTIIKVDRNKNIEIIRE